MKLSLKHPDSDKLMAAIWKVIPDFYDCPDFCGRTLGDICFNGSPWNGDELLKDIALLAYGTDIVWQDLRFIIFVGDGPCSFCGSDDVEDLFSCFEHRSRALFTCHHCGQEFFVELDCITEHGSWVISN